MGGSSGGMKIDEGQTYFGGGAGSIPQDRLAGLGLGGNTNPGGYNPTMGGGSPQHPGAALSALFLGNSRNAAPTVQLPMIQRPVQNTLPRGNDLPQVAPPTGIGSAVPPGYVDVSGQRDKTYRGPIPKWNDQAGELTRGGSTIPGAYGDMPGTFAQGVYQSVHNPAHLLVPGQPGYSGSGGFGNMGGQGAPLSQAALLARAMNEAAAKKGQS